MRIDSNNNGFLDLILFILIFLFLLVVVCGPFLIYREIIIMGQVMMAEMIAD